MLFIATHKCNSHDVLRRPLDASIRIVFICLGLNGGNMSLDFVIVLNLGLRFEKRKLIAFELVAMKLDCFCEYLDHGSSSDRFTRLYFG